MTRISLPKRRTVVLGLAAGTLAPWLARRVHAQGANQASTAVQDLMALHAMTAYSGSTDLAPQTAIRKHLAHQPMPRLRNWTTRKGRFRGRLVAAEAQLKLMETGQTTTALCYNGMTPGPLIELWEGDRVEVEFFNQMHYPTTVHWHGLAVPADQDGAPQDVVEMTKSRRYHFTLPKGSAGTHWYHPHPHMMTAEQVYRGLAGAVIVRSADDPLAHLPEQEFFISDLKLAADGNIPPNDREDWMNGREGQFILVNGRRLPRVTLRGTERWRIWNACSARYLRLSLGGMEFTQVGTDGGLLATPRRGLKELLLAPAERAEIVVTAPQGELRSWLIAEPYDRGAIGRLAGASPRRMLADIDMLADENPHAAEAAVPDTLRTIEPLGKPAREHVAAFSDFVDLDAPAPANPFERPTDMMFLLNGQAYDLARVDVESRAGEVQEWTLVNASAMGMDHPFHIHGGHFQVLDRTLDGVTTPEPFLAWRDTINLKATESARIRMRINEPGLRMFHCHILEHEDLGMMGNLLVKK